MGSRPPWATARRSGRPGNKEFNAPEADFGQAQGRLVFADERCPPRQKKVAAFRGRAMLAPTLLTKCGSRTNLSVGFAASSLRQKKLAALGFESALRGGRPSQPSVRTGQLPQRGSQGGAERGGKTNLSVMASPCQLPLGRGAKRKGNDSAAVGAAIGRPPVLFGYFSRTSDARPYGSDEAR